MKDPIKEIRKELRKNADPKTKTSGERFFKEKVKLYGVKTAIVSRMGKDYFKTIKELDKPEIFSLCEDLWQSGYMEESFIACNWSYFVNKKYTPDDFKIFERWIESYIGNWASCDTFCNHTVGAFVEMYPKFIVNVKKWTKSKNRWMRRAAAVSLIVPARKGKFMEDIFEIADSLLVDQDDLVQKGYGWMLKVLSQTKQKAVFDYVMENKQKMPRTALRYAIEKMPKDLRSLAMAK